MNFGIIMTDMPLEDIDILTLLPQRPPFVMVDRLVHFDQTATTTQFLLRADNLFMEPDGLLNPCALIENIAQTCAARMGYINQYIYKNGVKLGFIGAIKNLQILRPVRQGELLTTHIEVVEEVMRLTLVNASVRIGQELVATAEMKIALSDIDA